MNKTWFKLAITSGCTVAMVCLSLCAGIIAPFSLIFGLCASVFLGYLYISCGAVCAVICSALTAALVFLLGGGTADALLIAAIGILPGLVSGIMQKHKFEYYEVLGGLTLAFATVIMAILYIGSMEIEGGISGFFDQTSAMMKSTMAQLIKESGVTDVRIEDVNVLIEESIKLIKRTIPSVVIIFSMIFGYIHIAIVKILAKNISGIRVKYVRLDKHIAPKHMAYVCFAAMLLLIFMGNDGIFGVILNNSVSVFDFILAFCGLSFIESKLKEKLKYFFVRVIIYAFVFAVLSSIAMQLLSIVGMIDSFINYRRIKRIGE